MTTVFKIPEVKVMLLQEKIRNKAHRFTAKDKQTVSRNLQRKEIQLLFLDGFPVLNLFME